MKRLANLVQIIMQFDIIYIYSYNSVVDDRKIA